MPRWLSGLVSLCVLGMLLPACSSAPRQKPIGLGEVDTGPGSLEATRRALQGTWSLVSLELVDPAGARKPVKATGQLTYDAYGSMKISGRIDDAPDRTPVLLDFSGRIVIDTQRKQFYPADLVAGQPVDQSRLVPVSPDKARRYEITADTLTVTYMDAGGKPTAVANWRRAG